MVGGATMRERRFCFGTVGGMALPVQIQALWRNDAEPAVCSDARQVPVAQLTGGRIKKRISKPGVSRVSPGNGPRMTVRDMLRLQGFPESMLDECPLTESGKRKVIGNGVPLPMGRAIARAVKAALGQCEATA
jgi:DNA (cytosine-5)-methyltransferase 1